MTFGKDGVVRILAFGLLVMLGGIVLQSSSTAEAAIVCDTDNGFSWDGNNCSKTETVDKECRPHRDYPNTATNSALPQLNNDGTCTVQKVGTAITQEFNTQPVNQLAIDTIEIDGVSHILALNSASIEVYPIDSGLDTFNTTSIQTITAPAIPESFFQYSNVSGFIMDSTPYLMANRRTTTSGEHRVEIYKWDGAQFVFEDVFITASRGSYNISYFEIDGESFIGVGSQIHQYDTTNDTWDFVIGGADPNGLNEGAYSNFGGDHFYISSAYGAGVTPKAFKYDTSSDTWSQFYAFPGPVQSSGFVNRFFIGNYEDQTPGNITLGGAPIPYPTGYYAGFGTTLYEWDGTSFNLLTGSDAVYSPYYNGRLIPNRYNQATLVTHNDYHYFIGGTTNTRLCTSFIYNHDTTGDECVQIQNGANQSNIGDVPRDNAVLTDDSQIFVYSVYAFAGRSGIVASTRLVDEIYTSTCPPGYISDGVSVSTCSRTAFQNGGEYYELESSDLVGQVDCLPDQLTRAETAECTLTYQVPANGLPVRLPAGGDTVALISTATGTSSPCVLDELAEEIICSDIPASDGSFGVQDINLELYGESVVNVDNVTIISSPRIDSITPDSAGSNGGVRIVLSGGEFYNPTSVLVGSEECADIQYISESEVSCILPEGSVGEAPVTLTNADGETASATFVYSSVNEVVTEDGENGAPNGGDGNDDGVQDSIQDDVASFPSLDGDYITIDGNGCEISKVRVYQESELPEQDSAYEYPMGLIEFEGGCTLLDLEAYLYTGDDGELRKYNNGYGDLPEAGLEQVFIDGSAVLKFQYQVADGSDLDESPPGDGLIKDPFGYGVPLVSQVDKEGPSSLIRTGGN